MDRRETTAVIRFEIDVPHPREVRFENPPGDEERLSEKVRGTSLFAAGRTKQVGCCSPKRRRKEEASLNFVPTQRKADSRKRGLKMMLDIKNQL